MWRASITWPRCRSRGPRRGRSAISLRALCAAHDAPRVLKVDNGSPFVSAALAAWAHAAGTTMLHSPPACPRYNGSIEASIGAISTRAHHAAAAHGHPDYWTTDDVEHARSDANLVRRLHHGVASSAAFRWRTAPAITHAERRRFRTQCAAELQAHRSGDRVQIRTQHRRAIVTHARSPRVYCNTTEGGFSPLMNSQKAANIMY